VDYKFHNPFRPCPLDDGMSKRAFEQFGYNGKNIYSYHGSKIQFFFVFDSIIITLFRTS